MREIRTYGSVRGARGNSRPYRDEATCGVCLPGFRGAHPGYERAYDLGAILASWKYFSAPG